MKRRGAGFGTARRIALVGIMAATVECGKLALASIPNVEVVTLLLGLYSYVFGWLGICSAIVFVCIEPLIWGVGTWVVSYFIYWPLLALTFMILGRMRLRNRFALAGIAVALTVFFGVLTSLVDVGLFSGAFDRFFVRFGIYYMRGIPFYLAQTICNAVLFVSVFPFLSKKLQRVRVGLA